MKVPEISEFESTIARLRTLAELMEDDSTNLDISLKAYEEGITLVRKAQDYLNTAEQRIVIMSGDQGANLEEQDQEKEQP